MNFIQKAIAKIMLYYLALWIKQTWQPHGFGVFQYISFRAAAAAITGLLISIFIGPIVIKRLKKHQIGEQAKSELQSVGEHAGKAGTPTMGGLILIPAFLIPTLLWANISNMFIIMIVLVTAWLCAVGFLDDYLKVVKKLKKGLIGRYKIVGQVGIGLILGCTIYFFPEKFGPTFESIKTLTTIPFSKNFNLDWGVFYIPIVIFIITATSNAVNLTDGLDGLAVGTVAISALAFAIIAYFSGNAVFAQYLNIMQLRGSDELVVFCAAIFGASMGFLWYNAYPAQVFLGDTGSLALGGALGAMSLLVKKELLLPILGGIFFAETISRYFASYIF